MPLNWQHGPVRAGALTNIPGYIPRSYKEWFVIDKIPKDCKYLWVFPYGFIDYFKKKEKGSKGKWITTIPKFKIL